MSKLLSVEEAAKQIRVSSGYLLDTIVANGELKPINGTGGILFDAEDVHAYVAMDINRRKNALKDMAEIDPENPNNI